ncbi:MAG: sigma-54 dependent transcriptional regulator [Pseudomonadota bacterium]
MSQQDVMIVEDDISLREALCDTLEMAGYSVVAVENGLEALDTLAKRQVGLIVSDVQMPKMDGIELLERIKCGRPETPVLLMTAHGTIQRAVEAIQAGAADYLVKPFEADVLVEQVGRHIGSQREMCVSRIVEDAKMKRLFALAAKVARSDVTVLIQGESGTGKEVLARYIHQNSMSHAGPFVAINCAAIPENMLEAVLFGYEKGAFTGACQAVPGKFEQAQGGTLLLDEISEMDLALQAKLLRVLQEREVERLGGRRTIKLDVRVLTTTNRNLREQGEAVRFREEWCYRLNVCPLNVPPLRERRSDIVPLAQGLLRRHWRNGKVLPQFDENARACLAAHAWPGNVRELENVVQRALILQTGEWIAVEDLAFEETTGVHGRPRSDGIPKCCARLEEDLRSTEEQIILDTLQQEQGSRKSTADKLGISPRTLRYKLARMREAGIAVPC